VLAAVAFINPGSAQAQTPFSTGNIAVYSKGSGAAALGNTATQINIVELSSSTLNQPTPVQTVNISTPLDLWTSGTATSTGYLKLSPNNSLTFTGHVGVGSGNINTNTARAAAAINLATGAASLATTYTGTSGNQTRSAVTSNGTDYYIADQGGIFQNGGAAPALLGNFRGTQIINNQSYVGQQSGTATNIQVSATNPALPGGAAPTITGLAGLTNSTTVQDFILLSTTGGAPDLLYTSTTTGINKFSFDGTNWVAQGSTAITGGTFGITARLNAISGFDIFYTTGSGATAANRLEFQTDSAAFNATIALGGANVLYTAPANTTLAGIALTGASVAVPEPTAYALVGLTLMSAGGIMLYRRRQQAVVAKARFGRC
jgi:hypothetical protein